MTDQTNTTLTQEIKSSWVLQWDNWYIHLMHRRGNKTAFFICLAILFLLLFVTRWLAATAVASAFFMCFTSIYSGIKERRWSKKYNLPLSQVQSIIGAIYQ